MIQRKPGHKSEKMPSLRSQLYEILEQGAVGSRVGVIVGRALILLLIIINLAAVTAESVPAVGAKYRVLFLVIETVSLVVFTLEYALRLWVAVEHKLSSAKR